MKCIWNTYYKKAILLICTAGALYHGEVSAQTIELPNPDAKRKCSRIPIDRYHALVTVQDGHQGVGGVDLTISAEDQLIRTFRTDINGHAALDLTPYFQKFDKLRLQAVSQTQGRKDTLLTKQDIKNQIAFTLTLSKADVVAEPGQKTTSGKKSPAYQKRKPTAKQRK